MSPVGTKATHGRLLSRGQRLQLLLLDAVFAALAVAAATALFGNSLWLRDSRSVAAVSLMVLAWLVATHIHGPYLREVYHSRLLAALHAVWGLGLATLASLGIAHLAGLAPVDGWLWHLLALMLMVAAVVLSRILLARGPWWATAAPAIALLGEPDDRSRELVAQMQAERRCRVVFWWSAGPPEARESWSQITHLVLLSKQTEAAGIAATIQRAGAHGVEVCGLDAFFMDAMQRAPLLHPQDVCDEAAIVPLTTPAARFLHRVNDLVMCALLAPLALVLVAVSMVAVKLTSAGPVVFKHQRAGLDEQPITVYKIRTMVHRQDGGFSPTAECDKRVTSVGRLLRRLRIDELPQLLCVLLGHMSLIGPRPESVERYRKFKSEIALFPWRKKCAPGITGWAQVNFGYGGEDEDALPKLCYDLYYVHRQSPLLDLRIMLRTPFAILLGRDVR